MSMLRCQHLRLSFGAVRALNDVTVAFTGSAITAIIGPNGAGKTTLLNVLTGFLRPDEGQCFVRERNTTRMAAFKIARLGIRRTYQELRLVTLVSAMENVLLARRDQRGERLFFALTRMGVAREELASKKRCLEALDFVGLGDIATVRAGDLSYGQQKLLSLAVCLAAEAPILFFDEPLAGVSPQMIERIGALLLNVKQAGKTVIFIEHDIEAVRQIADHVIVMDEGKIVTQGRPAEVLEKPEIMEAYLG